MATRILPAILFLTTTLSGVLAEDLQLCGDAQYYPGEYTCFDDSTLCPILFGLPNKPCNGGCYAPEMYQCDSGKLNLLPEADGPFKLVSQSGVSRVDDWEVRACGNYFAIGTGARECNSCAEGAACDEYGNETVLLANGEMVSRGCMVWHEWGTDSANCLS